MNVFKAIKMCKDIKSLRRNGGKERIYHYYNAYFFKEYSIDILGDKSKITSAWHRKSISDEKVPFNLWTCLTGTYGNYKTTPVYFDVNIENNGFFKNIPAKKDFKFKGLAARIVYNKMRREYKLAAQHGPDVRIK